MPAGQLTIPQAIQAALEHHRGGRLAEAESIYRQVLEVDPANADALHLLGTLAYQVGNCQGAVQLIGKAIQLQPSNPFFFNNLGNAYWGLERLEESERSFRAALANEPDYAEAHSNLGNVLRALNRLEEAEQCYRRAVAIRPEYFEAHNNLGNALMELGRPQEAEQSHRQALALNPNFAEACNDLGNALRVQGRLEQAEGCYRRALELNPNFADAHNNLGAIFREQGKEEDCETCFRRALELRPHLAEAHNNLGNALRERGKPDEAASAFRRALQLKPENPDYRLNLTQVLQQLCDWDRLDPDSCEIRASIRANRWSGAPVSPFHFLALPDSTAGEQHLCAQNWAKKFIQPSIWRGSGLKPGSCMQRSDKLRIGYLSADFHDHATARLMAEVFEKHDRTRLHVTAYSYGRDDGSAMRERLKRAFDRFADLRTLSDEDAAKAIHGDAIEILVDLKGYTGGARTAIPARRPAPIQVSFLGYPGTMGAEFMDYLVADRFIVPHEHSPHYTERIVRLPDCYQPNDRTRPRPPAPARAACGLPQDAFVFCCFNQTYKITPLVFDVWCRLLEAVPEGILWLLRSNPTAEINLKREAQKRGIDPQRLFVAPFLDADDHLARLQCADLFLDTLPYNAHTTCSDALWMGLPVVTCAGETFPSRVAGSLLTAIGVPQLIAHNLEDYFSLALDLARNRARLGQVRSLIRAHRDTAPLFDSGRFTRNLEQAYFRMVEEWGDHCVEDGLRYPPA